MQTVPPPPLLSCEKSAEQNPGCFIIRGDGSGPRGAGGARLPPRAPHHTVSQPPAKKSPRRALPFCFTPPCVLQPPGPARRRGCSTQDGVTGCSGRILHPGRLARRRRWDTSGWGSQMPSGTAVRPGRAVPTQHPSKGGKPLTLVPESPPSTSSGVPVSTGRGLSGGPCGDPAAPTSSGRLSSAGFQSPRKAQVGARSVPRGTGARARHGRSPLPGGLAALINAYEPPPRGADESSWDQAELLQGCRRRGARDEGFS